MATVYNVEFKVVSDFCAYSSKEILEKLVSALFNKKFIHDEKNDLDLQVKDLKVVEKK